jgi:hypothetical protein
MAKVENLSFDPWGRRRNPTTWTYTNVPTTFLFDRGYTGHEHLDKFGLITNSGPGKISQHWVAVNIADFFSPKL